MNSMFSEGNSLSLHTAVRLGHVEHVRKILDKECLDTENLCDVLHYAVSYGQVEVARLLIVEYKCPVDCRNKTNQTPLHIACKKGHLSVVKMLVSEHKADLYKRDKDNDTPLHEAAWCGQTDIVLCLINEFSCNPSIKGVDGTTILHYASCQGHIKLACLLYTSPSPRDATLSRMPSSA